jgi:hypothetical protein
LRYVAAFVVPTEGNEPYNRKIPNGTKKLVINPKSMMSQAS